MSSAPVISLSGILWSLSIVLIYFSLKKISLFHHGALLPSLCARACSCFIYSFTFSPFPTPTDNYSDALNMDLLFLFICVLAKYVLLICMHTIEFHINGIGSVIIVFSEFLSLSTVLLRPSHTCRLFFPVDAWDSMVCIHHICIYPLTQRGATQLPPTPQHGRQGYHKLLCTCPLRSMCGNWGYPTTDAF